MFAARAGDLSLERSQLLGLVTVVLEPSSTSMAGGFSSTRPLGTGETLLLGEQKKHKKIKNSGEESCVCTDAAQGGDVNQPVASLYIKTPEIYQTKDQPDLV